jgi:hypothetical protein
MWGEAAVGFAEGADQRTPVFSAEFCVSVVVGVIKFDLTHDEFNSPLQATRLDATHQVVLDPLCRSGICLSLCFQFQRRVLDSLDLRALMCHRRFMFGKFAVKRDLVLRAFAFQTFP